MLSVVCTVYGNQNNVFSIKVAKAMCLDSMRHAVTGRADAHTVEKLQIVEEEYKLCLLSI